MFCVCTHVVTLWDHGTLCDLNPSGRHGFNFLMGNIKWVVVLREYCLGGPLGFVLFFHSSLLWGWVAEELNPASWPPLCFSCVFFPWFLCSTGALHLLLQCYLLFSWCRCSLCVTFASLVFSSAPSRISLWVLGALLIATKDLPCCV